MRIGIGGSPVRQASSDQPLEREAAADVILESIEEGVCGLDAEGRVAFLNHAATRILGWGQEEAIGKDLHALVHHTRADGTPYPVEECPIQRAAREGVPRRVDDEVLWRRNGDSIPVEYTATPMRENGRVTGAVVVFKDIRERLEAERQRREAAERFAYLARHDELTGLVSRAFFRDRLEHALRLAERREWCVALMFIDLDRFKWINDTLGHDAGDLVLQHVASCLQASVRKADTVARLGGDEFMVLMENVNEADAAGAAQRIATNLAGPLTVQGQECSIDSSIGVAMYPRDGRTEIELRHAADAAMYRAKLEPGAGFRFFTREMSDVARERIELVEALHRAVGRDELELHYQPQVDLARGGLVSVEALLRWRRPGHGLVDAGRWIGAAKSTGLIVPIGEWALRTACEQAARWRHDVQPGLRVAVNIGARELHPVDFAERVRETLEASGLEPGALEFEVAEEGIVERARPVLAALRDLGVTVILDDFGTGRFTMRGLDALPLDAVKIDRIIVANLEDAGDQAVARSVIGLAHDVGLRVYAVGVETEAQREFLRANGCDAVEGYLISHPLSPEALERWLAR
jgi:diguanylate cyclase (GGDEF)-like protein/PAS domain S-box-containing protein